MKFNFRFSNLCGTAYKQGNLLFSPDGNQVYSPVGNRVTMFDLAKQYCKTLNFEARKNIRFMALDPLKGQILVTVDVEGRGLVINVETEVVLHRINFKSRVKSIAFSPCCKFLAVGTRNRVQVWKFHLKKITQLAASPVRTLTLDYSFPLMLHKTFFSHRDPVSHIAWHPTSRFIISGAKDGSAKLWSPHENAEKDFKPVTFSGLRDSIVASFFLPKLGYDFTAEDSAEEPSGDFDLSLPKWWEIWLVSKTGEVNVWEWKEFSLDSEDSSSSSDSEQDSSDEDSCKRSAWSVFNGTWQLKCKHKLFRTGATLTAASVQPINLASLYQTTDKQPSSRLVPDQAYLQNISKLLLLGYSNGTFSLHSLPDANLLQELSISKSRVSSVALNPTGEWLTLGCADLGQIVVWEWQSETFVLKQQGHFYNVINCATYSPNGSLIATGGDDGKLKIWSTTSAFCFVTFTQHLGPITATAFTNEGNVVISASSDGTVRAFDLVRYRNFRIMTSPDVNVQFTCVTVDPSGELVAAGALSLSRVYLWRLQTGALMEVLNGHDGPISGVDFSLRHLVSSSWDKTIRVWDIYGGGSETLEVNTDLLCAKIRGDGNQICACGLNGNLYFFNVDSAKSEGIIEGARDICGGQKVTDRRQTSAFGDLSHFSDVSYSADGRCVIAAGRSKFVCIYDIRSQMLLKKFQISCNRSLDGVVDFLNTKKLLDNGRVEEMEVSDSDSDAFTEFEKRNAWNIKGGDITRRTTMPEIRCKTVQFSPTNEQFIASSTEGLLIYSLDSNMVFDPIDINEEVTPESVVKNAEDGEFVRALAIALRLGDMEVVSSCVELVPETEDSNLIKKCARSVTRKDAVKLLKIVGDGLSKSKRVGFYMRWLKELLTAHSEAIRNNAVEFVPVLRKLQQVTGIVEDNLTKVANNNIYSLQSILIAK